MSKLCEILLTVKGGKQVSCGQFEFDGNQIVAHPAMGYEPMFHDFITDKVQTSNGAVVTAQSDPEAWLDSLPINFNGSLLNAKIL